MEAGVDHELGTQMIPKGTIRMGSGIHLGRSLDEIGNCIRWNYLGV